MAVQNGMFIVGKNFFKKLYLKGKESNQKLKAQSSSYAVKISSHYKIVSLTPTALLEVILYGGKMLQDKSNHRIFPATINYIKNTQRFEQALFRISEGHLFYQLATNVLVYF